MGIDNDFRRQPTLRSPQRSRLGGPSVENISDCRPYGFGPRPSLVLDQTFQKNEINDIPRASVHKERRIVGIGRSMHLLGNLVTHGNAHETIGGRQPEDTYGRCRKGVEALPDASLIGRDLDNYLAPNLAS